MSARPTGVTEKRPPMDTAHGITGPSRAPGKGGTSSKPGRRKALWRSLHFMRRHRVQAVNAEAFGDLVEIDVTGGSSLHRAD